jgi:hypothetical protein
MPQHDRQITAPIEPLPVLEGQFRLTRSEMPLSIVR